MRCSTTPIAFSKARMGKFVAKVAELQADKAMLQAHFRLSFQCLQHFLVRL